MMVCILIDCNKLVVVHWCHMHPSIHPSIHPSKRILDRQLNRQLWENRQYWHHFVYCPVYHIFQRPQRMTCRCFSWFLSVSYQLLLVSNCFWSNFVSFQDPKRRPHQHWLLTMLLTKIKMLKNWVRLTREEIHCATYKIILRGHNINNDKSGTWVLFSFLSNLTNEWKVKRWLIYCKLLSHYWW